MRRIQKTAGGTREPHEYGGEKQADPRRLPVPADRGARAGGGGGGGALGSALDSDRRPRPSSAVDRAKASVDEAVARGIEPASSVDPDDFAARMEGKAAEPGAVVSPADNGEIGDKPFRFR